MTTAASLLMLAGLLPPISSPARQLLIPCVAGRITSPVPRCVTLTRARKAPNPQLASPAAAQTPAATAIAAQLYEALKSNDVSAVKRLLKHKPHLNDLHKPAVMDVRATAYHEAPFLYWALLFRCRPEILRALVTSGAGVNFRFSEPEDVTLLMQAAYQFPAASVRFLLDHGARINTRTVSGRTALMFAVTDGDPALGERYGADGATNAALLISRGARVGARDSAGRSAVMIAAKNYNGSAAPLAVLIAHGAKVNEADAAGATPLMHAAQPANLKAVKLLLQHGARVRASDREGQTALMYALYPHCSKVDLAGVVEALCRAGIDINARDKGGYTALDYVDGWEERIAGALPVLERYHAVLGPNPRRQKPPP